MSRVGKKPIPIPAKTKVTVSNGTVTVQGEKGKLERPLHPDVELKIEGDEITVVPVVERRKITAVQGLVRSLVANMVTGVSTGFKRVLEVNGIGYKAELNGQTLNLTLGFSHPVDFPLPQGITAEVDKKNNITLEGIDNELLGQTAASIRALRPPEPYKGKGIKYAEERIIRKAGKTGA
ncbi:50S ribosomal protein L6 [Desulfatibacillum aliphaticivorans]|uniref:Large ribosomal subunit protein uL6 n=1 Tax=Desulfatibacillum aliphaticivorans TaxID=218208 RepID=RL6_DESAL|nr:50S ribosomal protein L6 [Desulfatibacillum aliphaticivorans]B8FES0.1 RecName: Full=Large ribosomal subunit protein uL6; AltName: Full=50S ribosomal protein L6 [Desulfatibacillum aliphaticivorans]ACL03597.1 ribosomal protein L6 signature 1 [Desulfatibacillum aliphaticivorans]